MYGFNEDYGTASRPSDVLKVTLYTARVNSGYRPPLEEFFEEPRKTRYCIATHRTLKKNAFFFDPQSGLGKFPTIRNEFNDGLTDCRPWDYLMFFLAEKVFKREAVPPSMAAAERKITFMGYNTDLWFRTLDGGLFKPDKLIYEEDAMDLGDLEGPSVIMVRKEWNISNPARPQLQVSLANDLQ
ncbi:MAG: hypothetical protein M1833_001432 [Piccolia ochrophora]|nr:MAG: hypothetical protein M1833_001432 [Piccolia ochrophora]